MNLLFVMLHSLKHPRVPRVSRLLSIHLVIVQGEKRKLQLSSTGEVAFAVLSKKMAEPVTDAEIKALSSAGMRDHLLHVLKVIASETDEGKSFDRKNLFNKTDQVFGIHDFIFGKVLRIMRNAGLIESVADGLLSLTQRGRDVISKVIPQTSD